MTNRKKMLIRYKTRKEEIRVTTGIFSEEEDYSNIGSVIFRELSDEQKRAGHYVRVYSGDELLRTYSASEISAEMLPHILFVLEEARNARLGSDELIASIDDHLKYLEDCGITSKFLNDGFSLLGSSLN